MKQQNSDLERPFAIITGASWGVGFELARQFLKNDYDLLIISNSEKIEEARLDLEDHGCQIFTLQTDLSTSIGVENLCHEINSIGRPVDVLVINTGVGGIGEFIETRLKDEFHLLRLNIFSPIHLTKRILKEMVKRRSGKILFISSMATTMPSPYEAVYGASKAFISSFSDSIRSEVKEYGITVTAIMLDSSNTFFLKDKYENNFKEVARQGFEALMLGEDHVFSESLKRRIQGFASKYIPSWIKEEYHKKLSESESSIY